MARFLFPLSLVLICNSPVHLVLSTRESQVAPDHYHFSADTSSVPKQLNSSTSSYSLYQFQTTSSSAAAVRDNDNNSPKNLGTHASQTPTMRSEQITGANESGDDALRRRNFNDRFVPSLADFTSPPQPSTRLPRRYKSGVAVPVPSFWSVLVSDTSRETTERRKRRSLSTTKVPTKSGISEALNSNLSFVQEQQSPVLKLDRNYTPKDIAEYIVSTGDERGIIQVVADMVQDGQLMASRDDVIFFLETVQRELSKLKALDKVVT